MEEVQAPQLQVVENTPNVDTTEERFKTLGVRLSEELHAQLSFIAQLRGNTITEEIRQTIEARVLAAQEDPELVARAETVRGQIEREAETRRQAIAGFFGKVTVAGGPSVASPASDRTSRRRGAGSTPH